jgi:hypothetical protein
MHYPSLVERGVGVIGVAVPGDGFQEANKLIYLK